jgi:tetratricopeptide (TPR) repeat protein
MTLPMPGEYGDLDVDQLTDEGHRLLDIYAETSDEPALRRALAAYERALEALPPGEEAWTFLSNLGNCLRLVHQGSGDLDALARAVDLLQTALRQVQPATPDHALVADNLALVLRDRFIAGGNAGDLRRAVELHAAAVAGCGGAELPRYLNNLGGALWELYGATGEPAPLERAVRSFEAAIEETPDGSLDLPMYLSNLASALAASHQRSNDGAALSRALEAASRAVATAAVGSPDRSRQLSGLAGLLMDRFDLAGDRGDLDAAIELFRDALAVTDPRTQRHAGWSNNLGEALLGRFERTGWEADLAEAIEAFERAVALDAGSSTDPGRFRSGLGSSYGARFMLRGDRADLDRAIELLSLAVRSIPPDSQTATFAANRKHSLALLLEQRYQVDGNIADLEAAGRHFQESVDLTPPDSPAMPRRQASVGNALRGMYARSGDIHLLDEAIARYETALARVAPAAPARATYLDNLGMALLDRYECTGGIDDLDEAIRRLRAAREATPSDAEALPGILNNLGNALWSRHAHQPADGHLDEALDAFERAVARTAPTSPDAPIYLDNLANALSDRYEVTGEAADLTRAIRTYEQALDGLPNAALERPRVSTNLATSLLTRYRAARAQRTDDAGDLDRALTLLTDVATGTPPGAPALIVRLNNLGVALKYRYQRDLDSADLDRGREALREASGPRGVVDTRWSLAAALTLAGWAGERAEWDEAADAYRTALSTADDYLRVQLVRASTEAALRQVQGAYADAAQALARTGRHVEATAALERGRAVLLRQALERDRTAVSLLAASGGQSTALAERFLRAAARVDLLTGPPSPARAEQLPATKSSRSSGQVAGMSHDLPM